MSGAVIRESVEDIVDRIAELGSTIDQLKSRVNLGMADQIMSDDDLKDVAGTAKTAAVQLGGLQRDVETLHVTMWAMLLRREVWKKTKAEAGG